MPPTIQSHPRKAKARARYRCCQQGGPPQRDQEPDVGDVEIGTTTRRGSKHAVCRREQTAGTGSVLQDGDGTDIDDAAVVPSAPSDGVVVVAERRPPAVAYAVLKDRTTD